jgi:hypothetical protein
MKKKKIKKKNKIKINKNIKKNSIKIFLKTKLFFWILIIFFLFSPIFAIYKILFL